MRCPNCGHKNPEGARRCRNCGETLGYSKRERKVLLTGMALILLILVAGLVAMWLISRTIDRTETSAGGARPSILSQQQQQQSQSGDEQTPAPTEAPEPSATPEPTATPAPTPEPVRATLAESRSALSLDEYSQVKIARSSATSTIQQQGINNDPEMLYDGSMSTTWQEGKDDAGIGESVTFELDREYQIRYLILHLGSWVYEANYYQNNRPKKLSIQVGSETFVVDFPDTIEEHCVELSDDVPASRIVLTIEDVYSGNTYDDTVITEVEFYGY